MWNGNGVRRLWSHDGEHCASGRQRQCCPHLAVHCHEHVHWQNLWRSGSYDWKAIQLMNDIKDLFENGIGKNNEDSKKLKIHVYLEGDGTKPSRFATFAGAIERDVVAPFFFGGKMSYVDFYFANIQVMYHYTATTLYKLQAKTGVDVFAPFPKLSAIAEATQGLDSLKTVTAPAFMETFLMKHEAVEQYMS